MKCFFTMVLWVCFISVHAQKPTNKYVRITTNQGECLVKLYNETPLHRDNFVKLAKKGFYDQTLFHRVIKNFMIQGGDPDSKNAVKGQKLGDGDLGYTIPAEFNAQIFHKKGVLAAARDDHPQKASSSCQFYLVQGKVFTDAQLDSLETKRLKFKIPATQRQLYKTVGGTPHLDKNYTVYGEVVEGLALIDSIATVETDENDRPISDVKMTVEVLKRRQAKKLEKKLAQQQQKL